MQFLGLFTGVPASDYLEFFLLVFPVVNFPCAARVLLYSMSATNFLSPFGAEHGPGIITTSYLKEVS